MNNRWGKTVGDSIVYINADALAYNVQCIKSVIGDVHIIAVVKGNAYGHGIKEVASILFNLGVSKFCVSSADEGAVLRKILPDVDIYMLDTISEGNYNLINSYILIPTIYNEKHVELAYKFHVKRVQIEVNTGIGRSGCDKFECDKLYNQVVSKGICVDGVFSHLYDNRNYDTAVRQLNIFKYSCSSYKESNYHIINSGGLTLGKEFFLNGVRVGQALYGLTDLSCIGIHLKQVMTLKAKIIEIIKRNKGERIGYGEGTVFVRDTVLGVVNIGYMHGYPRHENGYVMVDGKRANIIGGINMLNMCIDLTDIDLTNIRYEVELYSHNVETGLDLIGMSERLNTIPNTLSCGINDNYVKRVIV